MASATAITKTIVNAVHGNPVFRAGRRKPAHPAPVLRWSWRRPGPLRGSPRSKRRLYVPATPAQHEHSGIGMREADLGGDVAQRSVYRRTLASTNNLQVDPDACASATTFFKPATSSGGAATPPFAISDCTLSMHCGRASTDRGHAGTYLYG